MRTNVTRAAEGFDRRSFTVDEILRIQDAGIVSEDENFELIEGEIVPKQAKTHVHELIKSALYPRGIKLEEVKGSDIRLAIEVALTSLPYDRWVIDAANRRALIHQGSESKGWRSIAERGPDDVLTAPALPGFSIELSEI